MSDTPIANVHALATEAAAAIEGVTSTSTTTAASSIVDDTSPAVAAAIAAVVAQDAARAAMSEVQDQASESKKRKSRSAASPAAGGAASVQETIGVSLDDPTTAAAVVVAAAAVADDGSGENEDEFSEDENDQAMRDVMAKMKEANEAALHSTGAGSAGGGALAARAGGGGEQRVQLYDSKRMSRVSFNSWYEFDAYFEIYMQETFQPFRMRSSCSVEAYRRNQHKVMMNNKNSRGRRIEFPDAAIHHHRIYMCTHAMKARCRGATTRPGQKYRGIGCIAKINVKISPSENPNKYMVIVTDQVVTHNHPISRDIYESYPDVLLKTMRRNQMTTALLTRQPSPKFDSPTQSQKYERAMTVLNSVADIMARSSDEDYEAQMQQLQKFYATIIPSDAASV